MIALPPARSILQSEMRTTFCRGEMNKAAILRQRLVSAIERKARKSNVVAAFGREQRRPAYHHQARRAAHAKKLCAVGKLKVAGAVDAGCQHQRRARARGLVDSTLQGAALIVRSPGAHTELCGVKTIGREWRCERSSSTGQRTNKQATAVDWHAAHDAPGKLTSCCRGTVTRKRLPARKRSSRVRSFHFPCAAQRAARG